MGNKLRSEYITKTGREVVFDRIDGLFERNDCFCESYVSWLEEKVEFLQSVIDGRSRHLKRRDLKDAYRAGYYRKAFLQEKEHGGSEYWDEEPKEFNDWLKKEGHFK